jgi:hypothetical protein
MKKNNILLKPILQKTTQNRPTAEIQQRSRHASHLNNGLKRQSFE